MPLLPEPPQDGKAIQSGKHQIQNDDVVVMGFNKPEAFISIAGRVNFEALFSQTH